jgi:multiple sugar transport system substrate-binding protein
MGGSAWVVSQHTKNPKLAVDLITYLTTSPDIWSTSPNFPAYEPIQPLFQKQLASNALFASDPFPAMSAAAKLIGSSDTWPRFDLISPLTQIVASALTNKQTIESVLPQVAAQFTPLAEAEGYQVDNPNPATPAAS